MRHRLLGLRPHGQVRHPQEPRALKLQRLRRDMEEPADFAAFEGKRITQPMTLFCVVGSNILSPDLHFWDKNILSSDRQKKMR